MVGIISIKYSTYLCHSCLDLDVVYLYNHQLVVGLKLPSLIWVWQRNQYTNTWVRWVYWSSSYSFNLVLYLTAFFIGKNSVDPLFFSIHPISLHLSNVWRRDGIICGMCRVAPWSRLLNSISAALCGGSSHRTQGLVRRSPTALIHMATLFLTHQYNSLGQWQLLPTVVIDFASLDESMNVVKWCFCPSIVWIVLWKSGWVKVQWRGRNTKPRASCLAITHHQR